MKHVYLTVAFLCAATFSFAQQHRILLGVEGGIGLADVTYSYPGINSNTDDPYESRMGYTIGITFQYNFSEVIFLRSGINYELKGTSSDVTFTDNSGIITGYTTVNDNYNYLVVPLVVGSNFGKKLNFHLSVGPYLGILTKRKSIFEDAVHLSNGKTIKEIDVTDDTEPQEIGVSGSLGFSKVLNEKIVLNFEVRDNKGLTDTNPYQASIMTNSVLFVVGAAYTFGSKKTEEPK